MNNKTRVLFYGIISLFLSFLGIWSCTFGDAGVPGSGSSGGGGILYLLDDFKDAVYVFDNVTALNGTASPNRTISGSNTLIVDPTTLSVDGSRDILYVADTNQQKILAFVPASQKNGNQAPLRTYPGLKKAGAMFYDSTHDRLYVTDIIDNEVNVWDSISNLADGAFPSRTIKLDYVPSGMVVDRVNNLLYVGDPAIDSIKVYPGVSTLSGNATPDHSFTNSTQAFANINALSINATNNILFVSESSIPSIEMFDSASTLSGAVAVTRRLKGSNTGLTVNLRQLIFADAVLYTLVNDTLIHMWDNANQLTGDTAPNRTLTVSGATRLVGLSVDLSR